MQAQSPSPMGRGAAALVGTLVAGSIGLTAGVTLALLAIAELFAAS